VFLYYDVDIINIDCKEFIDRCLKLFLFFCQFLKKIEFQKEILLEAQLLCNNHLFFVSLIMNIKAEFFFNIVRKDFGF